MPKILVYQRQLSIPGEASAVPANISSAGIVGESIAEFGKTGLAVTDAIATAIAQRNEEMRLQNNAFAVLKAQNSIDADMRAFKESYDVEAKKGDYDPAGLMKFTNEKTDAFFKEIDKKYLFNIEDPDQKIKVEAYRNAAVSHVLDHTSVFQANARKDFANNEVSKAVEMSLHEAWEGTDPGIVRNSMRLKIGELHASGYSSLAQAEDLIVKSDQQITVAYFDGLIVLSPGKAIEKLNDRSYRQYLPEADWRRLMEKAKTLNEKKIKEEKEMTAYAEASEKWPDAKKAMVEVLKPEFMKKHKLTINQAQNIAQSFNAIGAQKERDDKDRQDANLDAIRKVAINDPVRALKIIQTSEDLDPKEALSLQRATESHIRQMSLMSAQEKSLRMDLEDKIKAAIKAKIMTGGYNSEQHLTNAVIAEGLTNTSGFIDDALRIFRNFKKDSGSVNYFHQAEEDWNRLITTSKSSKRKRELQDMKPKMLESLRQQMEKDNLRISDPKVFEVYQVNRKALTETTFQKALDAVGSLFGGGDSFVAPQQSPAPAVPSAAMDEATARKRLAEKGVKGADQENWIKRYRAEGVVK